MQATLEPSSAPTVDWLGTTRAKIIVALTAMAAGRAMTIGWLHRVGDGGAGDPPDAWLMPLVGDALVGLAAIAIAVALVRRQTPLVWAAAIAWNSVAAFDALGAFLVDIQNPWPSFFMIELFGRSMFFAAAALHGILLWLLVSKATQQQFSVAPAPALA